MRAIIALFIVMLAQFSSALELVVVEQEGCIYCRKWDTEIAPIYPKTEVSKAAPLLRINIREVAKMYKLVRPVIYTPTFLLVHNGEELNRIEGYLSPDFFWAFTEKMVFEAQTRIAENETKD